MHLHSIYIKWITCFFLWGVGRLLLSSVCLQSWHPSPASFLLMLKVASSLQTSYLLWILALSGPSLFSLLIYSINTFWSLVAWSERQVFCCKSPLCADKGPGYWAREVPSTPWAWFVLQAQHSAMKQVSSLVLLAFAPVPRRCVSRAPALEGFSLTPGWVATPLCTLLMIAL